ncbi:MULTISPECIES: site-specific integrase [unclassified Mesorhizobium]|uniref:tyrosine-type recombinase/integrase n=1 Tax=unclassified Mesorhizobium TaxID=325217 RepID=UPI000FCAA865|nr:MULTISPECIES: site-specific integrase [unclassified Mesorhizobium]RUX97154.1 site-specific integrase [Mesorhizobium sp. M7D.F.Ca.US.004.01.2.1]RVA28290.1 site-specific integrase [Mesorhizobium sp. M7D.F.Ca.US.004.03.1.1]
MPTVELTDKFIQAAKCLSGRKTDYFDTIVKGLVLRASSGGQKTWYAVYGPPAKRQWLKLGTYPEIPLGTEKGARQRAKDTRARVGDGGDPVADKKALAASQTVADLVENYVARRASTKRSADEIARRLRKNVKDVIGDVKLAELHRRDLTKCIDAVKDRGAHVEANRVFEDLRAMVRWARGRGDLDENLAEGMSKPTETAERDRVLPADEIKTMWAALPEADMRESTRRIIRLCLITAQRVGEVAGMMVDELELDTAVWTIPPERSKNKREHVVPLSAMAVATIREQLADVKALAERKGREVPVFVFPGPGARAPVTGSSIPKAIKREEVTKRGLTTIMGIAPWTPHDLRRSAATGMEELGISPFIVGHVLNHVSATRASITSKVYARYSYDKEKRHALDLWADRLTGLVAGGTSVVSIGARSAA